MDEPEDDIPTVTDRLPTAKDILPVDGDERVPIMFHANAPWAGTGYGTQAALFGPRFAERLGYRVAFSAFYGLHGSKIGWVSATGKPYIIYPGARDVYGNDVIGAHCKDWFKGQKGLLVTLTDPWVLHAPIIAQLPCIAWTPVDHNPLMPRTEEWLWRTEALPLAMSRFGEEMMVAVGMKPLYVPHGFDSKVFYPADRDAARELFGFPKDSFVVGMVAANKGHPSRKCFAQAISAFSIFQKKVPEAILYLHTQLESPDGEDLVKICEACGVYPYSSDQYQNAIGQPPGFVANLLNGCDVLLNPSAGEGFGIPLIEAQACGTPCITTNFSSMPEVAPVLHGNFTVEGETVWTAFDSWQVWPHTDEIAEQLLAAYEEATADRIARRAKVAAWALQEYEVDHVTDTYWKPVLRQAQERFAFMGRRVRRHSTQP